MYSNSNMSFNTSRTSGGTDSNGLNIVGTWSPPADGVRTVDSTPEEMTLLFNKLPPELSQHIQQLFPAEKLLTLNEIYLQLGQHPECIFYDGHKNSRVEILNRPCTRSEIDIFAEFFQSDSNADLGKRRGISGTLHRVSLIVKPTTGAVLGVTVRVGRALQGLVQQMAGPDLLRQLANQRRSLLLIGKPGVGKTTVLREIACVLSHDPNLRVVVVDKSLEIAGDGDAPHAAIGKARWMPVGKPNLQHEVMLEAVENQSPDVVIVDEISNEKEVRAAQTMSQRGVMLIATVHGTTLAELVHDRERSSLVGGCSTVTLSGREAERRNDKKKQVLKRTREPVFSAAVELHSQQRWVYHNSVADVVDDYLDKEIGTTVVLEPGRAVQAMAFPKEGNFEYCVNCRSPEQRCSLHQTICDENGTYEQPCRHDVNANVGPFSVGKGGGRRNRKGRKKKTNIHNY